jgi:hypothetical protein
MIRKVFDAPLWAESPYIVILRAVLFSDPKNRVSTAGGRRQDSAACYRCGELGHAVADPPRGLQRRAPP